MKRSYLFLAVVSASAASAFTIASAQSEPTAHSGASATVQLRHTSLGKILVNSSGRTLYEFSRDHVDRSSCAGISGCAEIWPALKSGRPSAGAGIRSSLLSSHHGQVTYAGHPLYTYSADTGPGQTSYVGVREFGGTWYAVNVSGGAVR